MLPHPLNNLKIPQYYENESKFNGVYSRNNWSKIKDGANVIIPDEYESSGTHWTALYVNDNNATYFDSFRVLVLELMNIIRKLKDSLEIKLL